MCYGFDGQAALQRSLAENGASRRGLFKAAGGVALGGAALAAVTGAPAAAVSPAAVRSERGAGVKHDKISIQLYTLREAMAGAPGPATVLERLAQYGYELVERAGFYPAFPDASSLKAKLDALGIRASSSHDDISTSNAALQTKLENARIFGQEYIVVPYLISSSRSEWEMWADQMNAEAEQARRWGLKYGYHNHAHEFTTKLDGGVTPWDVLTSRLDPKLVHLEVDLYWAYTGGVNTGAADPDQFAIDVIAEAPQRVRQFHVKDRDAVSGDMADLGTGVVDFERIFRAHRVEEYIVENDTPDVSPLTSAAVGHLYLDHLRF